MTRDILIPLSVALMIVGAALVARCLRRFQIQATIMGKGLTLASVVLALRDAQRAKGETTPEHVHDDTATILAALDVWTSQKNPAREAILGMGIQLAGWVLLITFAGLELFVPR